MENKRKRKHTLRWSLLTVLAAALLGTALLAHAASRSVTNGDHPDRTAENSQTAFPSSLKNQTDDSSGNKEGEKPSLRSLLANMIKPVGKALYIWGGGWNEADDGAGPEGTTIGIPESWNTFMADKDSSYDYLHYTYFIHEGLDCSGLIGWGIYNTLETESGRPGYVTNSWNYGDYLSEKGWGTVTPAGEVEDFRPGDIMFNDSHVYLVLCAYEDGSILLVHSAIPSGVQISGTPNAYGSYDSMAKAEASQLMSGYYPDFYNRFPSATVDDTFTTGYSRFRWNESLFSDAAEVQSMTPEQILTMLYPDYMEKFQ